MVRLELQGKRNSQEYLNGAKAIKQNNSELAKNRARILELEKTLGLENMTMTQLQKRAQSLQGQMNNTVKSLQPEAYARLSSELQKTKDRMGELGRKVKEADTFLNKFLGRAVLVNQLSNLFTKISSKIFDFVNKGVEMARTAEGIERAFKKLNEPDLLDNLRNATRGTVNNLSLMQQAVKADNFKIPLENLATYFKFAQQRAQETGESVDYLVQSIILGIGRKSPLILDNLGISSVLLRETMRETGDMVSAVSQIINTELAKQGDLTDTAAEKAAARTAQLENQQLELGKLIKDIYEFVGHLFNNVLLATINTVVKLKSAITTLTSGVAAYLVMAKGKVAVNALIAFWNGKILQSTIALTLKEKLHTAATYAKALAHDE
jgi:hypothetical protein